MKEIIINGLLIELEKKRIKNLYLKILPPEGRIHISAPVRMSEGEIRSFVLSKQEWITEQQEKVIQRNAHITIDYVTGDKISVWGVYYPLVVFEKCARNAVAFDGTKIFLSVKKNIDDTPQLREATLNEWYRKELMYKLPVLIRKWETIIGVQSLDFTIRDMKTRWGTCNIRTHRICFNLQLAKKPPKCLEYVVVHELVHLLEKSHNHVFKGYMDQFLPGWRMIKKELNGQSSI